VKKVQLDTTTVLMLNRKRDEWNDMILNWEDDLECFANHMVFNMNREQRQQARGNSQNGVDNWV
jgi:hypothetical protein